MKLLTVDIGTGTQDIYLFDSRKDIENGFKLVLPSPTMMVFRQIKQQTELGNTLVLSGVTMGGGPSYWAVEQHITAGFKVFATEKAARSFNDDLTLIKDMGIQLIDDTEIHAFASKSGYAKIELKDFDFEAICHVFSGFGVNLSDLGAVSVAVFDHGNAPPNYSDRQFRFDYLNQRIKAKNRLSSFAYLSADIPISMTRLQAVAESAGQLDCPLIVMDTAPAAVLGATFDLDQYGQGKIIANIGNFHTLAFRLSHEGIDGVFEHHTGLIDAQKLDRLLSSLAASTLKHEDVFDDHGHGALIYNSQPLIIDDKNLEIIATGPRRKLMQNSRFLVQYAAPFGDMMMTGCFGLLSATSDLLPNLREPIQNALVGKGGSGTPPWELN